VHSGGTPRAVLGRATLPHTNSIVRRTIMPETPHFRLTTLLRLREATRDRRRVELAEVRQLDDKLAARLEELSHEQTRLQSQSREAAQPGAVDVERLAGIYRYAALLRDERDDLRRRRKTLAVEIERRRQLLVEADRDVRVLEKLRERRIEQHRLEDERRTVKQLDEAALQAAFTV
jgi:flagellar protein FliJ